MRSAPSRNLKRGSVLGATLIIALAITLVLAGLLKWVESEQRISRRHMLSMKAKYAAESVSEYAAAQIRSRLEYQTNVDNDEFTPKNSPPKMPSDATLANELVDLAEEASDSGILGITNALGLTGDGGLLGLGGDGGLLGLGGGDGLLGLGGGGGLLGLGGGGEEEEEEVTPPETEGAGEPAPPQTTTSTADDVFASSFSGVRFEVVTAESPLYAEDPLRNQKIFLRELSVLAAATAHDIPTNQNARGFAEQVIQIRDAPLFAYAVFYNMDMEIAPGQPMDVAGPVHSNANIYVQSAAGLSFKDVVSAAGKIFHGRKAGSGKSDDFADVKFVNDTGTFVPMEQGETWIDSRLENWAEKASQLWEGNVMTADHGSMPANPAGIPPYKPDDPLTEDSELRNSAHIYIEPATLADSKEYPGDDAETEKFATKACLVITVNNGGHVKIEKYELDPKGQYRRDVGAGPASYKRTPLQVPNDLIVGGMAEEKFTDKRRGKTIQILDLDIGVLKTLIGEADEAVPTVWKNPLTGVVEFDPKTEWNGVVYVEMADTENGGVRLVKGGSIPDRETDLGKEGGFTLATNVPAYIEGNYNADGVIADDVADIRNPDSPDEPPAAVIADAITILSNAWKDTNSGSDLGSRKASQTEVSAGLVSGIVPTNNLNNGTYSGGVENFPRFLENWNGIKFGYRGSMVALYESEIATDPWGASNVYDPPTRVWGFSKLFEQGVFPPGRLLSRSYRRLAYRSLTQAEYEDRLAELGLN